MIDLPNEIIQKIASCCDLKDQLNFRATCRLYSKMCMPKTFSDVIKDPFPHLCERRTHDVAYYFDFWKKKKIMTPLLLKLILLVDFGAAENSLFSAEIKDLLIYNWRVRFHVLKDKKYDKVKQEIGFAISWRLDGFFLWEKRHITKSYHFFESKNYNGNREIEEWTNLCMGFISGNKIGFPYDTPKNIYTTALETFDSNYLFEEFLKLCQDVIDYAQLQYSEWACFYRERKDFLEKMINSTTTTSLNSKYFDVAIQQLKMSKKRARKEVQNSDAMNDNIKRQKLIDIEMETKRNIDNVTEIFEQNKKTDEAYSKAVKTEMQLEIEKMSLVMKYFDKCVVCTKILVRFVKETPMKHEHADVFKENLVAMFFYSFELFRTSQSF